MYQKSTFTDFEFAFSFLLSTKLTFGKQNRHEMLNLVICKEETALDLITLCFIDKTFNPTLSAVCKTKPWIFSKYQFKLIPADSWPENKEFMIKL